MVVLTSSMMAFHDNHMIKQKNKLIITEFSREGINTKNTKVHLLTVMELHKQII